jgi:hypothetical protein
MAEAAQAGVAIENLTAQLRALKKELATLDPNSAKFQDLANKAGDVKDKINDAAEAMNANAGSAFEKLSGNASLLKDRLLNLDFEGVGSSVKALAGNIRGISFKDITSGIGGMISALGSLAKAILMNPILLLATVIIGIAMNFEKLKSVIPGLNEAMTGVSDEMSAALETSKKMSAEAQKQLDTTMASESSLKLQGKSEREILNIKINQTKERIKGLQAEIQAQKVINVAQFETAKRNKEILKGVIQFLTAPLQLLLYTVDEVGKALGQDFGLQDLVNNWTANLIFDPEEVQNEGLKVLEAQEKALLDLENSRDSYIISVQEIDKRAAEKSKADREKAEKDFEEAEKKRREQLYTAKDSVDKIDALGLESRAKKQNEFRTSQALLDVAAAQRKKEQEAEITAFLQKQNDLRIGMASDAIGSLMALNDAFANGSEKSAKRAFQINKALSLAQAIMSTYQAVNAQLAVPQDAITGANYVKAGISLAMGLANVVKISKTQFNSGSAGGSGGGGGGTGGGGSLGGGGGGGSMTSVTPAFNPLNTSFLNNRPAQTGAVQAYVLSSNVSSAMEANQKVKDQTVL